MKNVTNNTKKLYKRRPFIVITFIILIALCVFVSLRGEYLQVLEIGEKYTEVFMHNLEYKALVMVLNFLIIFISMYITNKLIKSGLKKFFIEEKIKMPKLPNKSISFIVSVLVSVFSSDYITQKLMLSVNATMFGVNDPIFNLDVGYYMFQKPFIELMILYFTILMTGLTIYTIAYYIISFNVYFENGINPDTLKKSSFIKQLIFYAIVIAFGVAIFVLFKTQDIIFGSFINLDTDVNLIGAGFTDTTIKLWGYRLLSVIIVLCVIMGIKFLKKGKVKKAIISLGTVPAYLILLFIVIITFQLIFVNLNELDKENKYIEYNIKNTKTAYNIDIEEVEIENSGTLTYEEFEQNQDVLNNIAILNEEIVSKNLEQYQSNVGYYSFNSTQLQKYNIAGKDSLVFVSPREIISDSNNRTYNSKTYEYTHGYGIVVTSATSTDEIGNIKYIQKDFDKKDEQIKIEIPQIYFGLETNDAVVTNTKNKSEFDYPINGDTNSEFTYNGEAGLSLNFIDRIILGIKEKDLKLAFTSNITNESKILTNRNIIDRAKTIMPHLLYDENPYMVISDEGRLVWVLDAYTISNSYPYSQQTIIEKDGYKQNINYIRNSVKVIIDAYNGTTEFYITDKTDQIAVAYQKMYPNLFIETDMPKEISEHIVYSKYLYEIQAKILERYHKTQTEVLYRNDDVWEVAKENTTKLSSVKGTYIEPYFTMIKTVDNETAKLGLVVPYTPRDKQNIISYLVGTYDNNEYKLKMYKFKSGTNILGTMQLNAQIEEDATISKELETVNIPGTKIMKNMIIVPINNTLLYVEPVYQIALNDKIQIPVLKKVIVASGNKLAIGNDLKEALENLLSQYAVKIEVENTDNVEDIILAIIKANKNLEQSNSNNNWEMIGKDMARLQTLIEKLEVLVEAEQNSTNPTEQNNIEINENEIKE